MHVVVDISKNIDLESLSEAQLEVFQQSIESLALATRDKWVSLAQNRLSSARSEYVRGLQENTSFVKNDDLNYEINLVGDLANDLEGGKASFDMKPGLLGGKAAAKNGGKYVTIPFRHFKNSSTAHANNSVPNYKNDLKNVLKQSGLGRIKKNQNGVALQGKVGTATGTQKYVNKLKAKHKTTIFEGLTQYQKTYSKTTQSQLMTFRRVSVNSPANSWIHPGFKALNLLQEVEGWVQDQSSLITESLGD